MTSTMDNSARSVNEINEQIIEMSSAISNQIKASETIAKKIAVPYLKSQQIWKIYSAFSNYNVLSLNQNKSRLILLGGIIIL